MFCPGRCAKPGVPSLFTAPGHFRFATLLCQTSTFSYYFSFFENLRHIRLFERSYVTVKVVDLKSLFINIRFFFQIKWKSQRSRCLFKNTTECLCRKKSKVTEPFSHYGTSLDFKMCNFFNLTTFQTPRVFRQISAALSFRRRCVNLGKARELLLGAKSNALPGLFKTSDRKRLKIVLHKIICLISPPKSAANMENV